MCKRIVRYLYWSSIRSSFIKFHSWLEFKVGIFKGRVGVDLPSISIVLYFLAGFYGVANLS